MKLALLPEPFRLLMAVASLLLGTGCAKSVYYGWEASSNNATPGSDITRLYFDREGSLYPAADDFLAVDNKRLAYHNAGLQYYYQVPTKTKWAAQQAQELQDLRQRYGLPPAPDSTSNFNANWQQLQDSMQTRFIRRFRQHLLASRAEAVVVLVHGFNNQVGAVTWYPALQREIRTKYFRGQRVQFLEVYWDGRTTWSPVPLRIWTLAQNTMYPVGLGVRRVLASISPATPLYLFGHSTGAPLLCVALWNSTQALSKPEPIIWGQPYRSLLTQPAYATPPAAHVRVALVAPAMPSSHFVNFASRTSALPTPDGYERFVVAHNRHDIATGKWIAPESWGGATTMGVRKWDYCGGTSAKGPYGMVPLLRQAGSKAETYLFNLTPGMTAAGERRAHGVLDFMKDKTTFKHLLDAWLIDAPVVGADTCP